MADTLFHLLSEFFARYGYWVIFFGVMLENGGLPVPGETVLLFAGFLAFHGKLDLTRAILAAIAGATTGDTLGYLLGRWGGAALLRRYRASPLVSARRFDWAEQTFVKFGPWTVFVARFITGLRVFAGPFAGAFKMPYPRFLFFNFTGAVLWACAIGWVGFLFGSNWQRLIALAKDADWIVLGGAVLVVLALVYAARRRHGKNSGK